MATLTKDYKLFKLTGQMVDTLLAILSMLDFVTDIIVLINWYNENEMVFFGIGISFIIIAQLSYSCIFHMVHQPSTGKALSIQILCTIPCLPFLQIAWTLVIRSQSVLRKIIAKICCCFSMQWNDFYATDDWGSARANAHHAAVTWLGTLCLRNVLYITHGVLESLPQCILQIVAIFHFKQTNNVSLSISILFSILMLCSQFYVPLYLFNYKRFWSMAYFVLSIIILRKRLNNINHTT